MYSHLQLTSYDVKIKISDDMIILTVLFEKDLLNVFI